MPWSVVVVASKAAPVFLCRISGAAHALFKGGFECQFYFVAR